MTLPRLAVFAAIALTRPVAHAADATTPVDYTQRNAPFAPAGSVAPERKSPAIDRAVQEKRVDKTTVEKALAPVGERRAPIDVTEARDKRVRAKESHRPEAVDQPTSGFNHRPAAISTGGDATKPPTVAKYQDSLTSASAANMARFHALDRATTAKINRFVFRKNPSEPAPVVGGSPVTPAAGGSPLSK